MKCFAIFITLGFLFFSCTKNELSQSQNNDQFLVELKPKRTSVGLVGIPKVKVINDLIVTIDLKDTNIIKVYNQEFKLLGGDFRLGEFPLELEFPVFSSPVVFDSKVKVPIYDLGKVRLIDFEVEFSFDSLRFFNEFKSMKNLSNFPKTVIYYSDSTAIYVPEVGGSLIFESILTKKAEIKPYQFYLSDKIKPTNYSYVFQSVGAINIDQGVIVVAPILTGEIEFYNLKGDFIKSVTYDSTNHQDGYLDQLDFGNTDLLINAIDISVTPEHVYILISNNKLNQYLTGKRSKSSSILKLDWNGRILGRYNLNVDANSFGVSESQKRFYVTLNENDDNPIVYFEFE